MIKYCFLLVAVIVMFVLQSCEKRNEHLTDQISTDATINRDSTYSLNLMKYGDEDDIATIATQATGNFTISQINNVEGTFNPTYTYQSNQKYTGKDKVVIEIKENHTRKGCNDVEAIITINFTLL